METSREGETMKKRMCSLALSAVFGLGVAVAAPLAQDQPAETSKSAARHHADPQEQLNRLSKKLNLTDDQQKQILPVLTARQEQMHGIWSDNSLSREDRQAKMRAIRDDSDAKIRAVLTDSQKQTYDQMQQQMREHEKQRHEQKQNSAAASDSSK
jgi:periplasmic protein CpxP/Spy